MGDQFDNEGNDGGGEGQDLELEGQDGADGADGADGGEGGSGPGGQKTIEEQLYDLESPNFKGRFKFGGKEFTAEEIRKGYLRQDDYTKKTQQLAEERKFASNLYADLRKIEKNPALADQFRQLYPKRFHAHLDEVLGGVQAKPPGGRQADPKTSEAPLDPRLQSALSKIESFEQKQREAEIRTHEKEIDTMISKYSSKYPWADEELVISRVQRSLAQKREEDPDAKIVEADWERAFKEVQKATETRVKAQQKQTINQQLDANSRGRDVGRGGGAPGSAPRLPRTIKEATAHALADIQRQD